MLNRVMIFGAHSYIGLGLCERLVREGIEVVGILLQPDKPIHQQLLDERLMMIGRNALFKKIEYDEEYVEEENRTIDLIIHCCDDGIEADLIEQDRNQLVKSVAIAEAAKIPYIFASSSNKGIGGGSLRKEHIKDCESYLLKNFETRILVHFPVLFGPFQPQTETIHQQLVNPTKRNEGIIVEEPVLFIEDAVDGLTKLLADIEQGKTYTFKSDVQEDKEAAALLKIQTKVSYSEQDEPEERVVINIPTSVVKGLNLQISFIEMNKSLME